MTRECTTRTLPRVLARWFPAASIALSCTALFGCIEVKQRAEEPGPADAGPTADAAPSDSGANPLVDAKAGCEPQERSARTLSEADNGASWSPLNDARETDGKTAEAVLSPNSPSKSLIFQDFGFVLPQGAAPKGIELILSRDARGNGVQDLVVQLAPGGTRKGDDKSSGTWAGSVATVTYGSPTDLWGLTQAQLADPGLELHLRSRALSNATGDQTARVDGVRVRLHLSCP
jgi:hypothetical protein